MSTVEKKILNVKINGEKTTVPEGTVVLEVCKQNNIDNKTHQRQSSKGRKP